MKLLVDMRCLQDPAFSFRGVGLHTAAVLRHARVFLPRPLEITGILDDTLCELPEAYRPLVDRLQHARTVPTYREPAVFLQTSPLTHDPAALGPLVGRKDILSCAIVYDFIPLEESRYLPTPQARRRYMAGLYWLKLHQFFYPISRYTGGRLREVVGVASDRVVVTGASVRDAFAAFDPTQIASIPHRSRFEPGKYFLLVGGNDERKNQACALQAHARSKDAPGLVLVGHHDSTYRGWLEEVYRQHGGRLERIEFVSDISDRELAGLYHRALVTVCPSRLEGFSLPVVEAIACGCPVLASSNEAHLELVQQPDALFGPQDPDTLATHMMHLVQNPLARASLLERQRPVAPRFAETEVAGRLWTHVARYFDRKRAPAVRSSDLSKPRLAILSPYPPDRSGVADYTAHSLQSIAKHARVDVFTDQSNPRRDECVHAFHPVSDLAYLQDEYDRVVAVAGNSHFHWRIIQLHRRYGGACLMHDNRLAELYAYMHGLGGFLHIASKTLGRPVSAEEATHWLQHPGQLPVLFFDDLLARADPLIVHSRGIVAQITRRYGVEPAYLPFCCYRHFENAELTLDERRAARNRLGVASTRVLIASLGLVTRAKGPFDCVYALEHLLEWGVDAELHFVGEPGEMGPPLRELISQLKLGDRVKLMTDWISDRTYRDYLLASDFSIQLRSHGFGGLSGAVLDTISAGLPTVCNEDLATAMDGPEYVLRVPDHFSSLLMAEQILLSWKAGRHLVRCAPAREEYVRDHSFDHYARRLLSVLGVAA